MPRLALLFVTLAAVACERYPRDPRGTLDRAAGGELRVGIVDAPDAARESELVRAFAADIRADVSWRHGSEHQLLTSLEHGEVDVVVGGGLVDDTPWKDRVALTRPYEGHRVLAVVPGENAFLLRLERFIAARKGAKP